MRGQLTGALTRPKHWQSRLKACVPPRALLISTTDGRRAAMGVLTVGSNLALLTACEPPAEALMAGATGAPRVIKGTDG